MLKKVALLVLTMSACISAPSQAWRVKVVQDERAARGCEHIHQVWGSSSWGGIASQAGRDNAMEQMRETAARLGANRVVVTKNNTDAFGAYVEGEAYACSSDEIESPAAPAAGCAKDTDCKGDRICVAGQCTSPAQ
ncbi:MAG: DUF4156 domain-containing protein [Myxococcota bacterium]